MKITMYELLGMVKDGKAPTEIIFDDLKYIYGGNEYGYERRFETNCYYLDNEYCLFDILNDEVEILEEEKKIPEETTVSEEQMLFNNLTTIDQEYVIRFMKMLQPPIMDYLKSKGE